MKCSTSLRLGMVVAFAMVIASVAGAQGRADDEHPLVRDIRLNGVQSVNRTALRQGLASRPTECRSLLYAPICVFSRSPLFALRSYLDPPEVRRDALRIRLFYWRRGYRDVVVTSRTEKVGGGVRIVFDIKENAPTVISRLDVTQSDSVLPTAEVQRLLLLRAGEPLDLVAMDSSMRLLRDALWERGYADARLALDTSQVSNEANAGPVTLALHAGRPSTIGTLNITGNDAVSHRTIGRLLHFHTGDLYRRSVVLESQRELYLSGLFTEVELSSRESSDTAKTLDLRVLEAPLHDLELSGGFTTADFLQLEAAFTRYHFLGGARRLTARATVSNLMAHQLNGAGVFDDVTAGAAPADRGSFLKPTFATSLEFAQPWFLSPLNQLGATIFTHRRSVPGVVTDNGAGATLAITRRLGSRSSATTGYTFEASRIEATDVYFCVSVGLCLSSDIAVVSARHPLAPLSFVAQMDRTDDASDPTRGVRTRLDVEHASEYTASDFAYNRATLTASAYRRVGKQNVLAGRVRLGTVRALSSANRLLGVEGSAEQVLHPRKLFYSGGSQSVRGYGENQLGPRVLTVDPAALSDTTLASPCSSADLASGSCDPNLAGVKDGAFQPRPLGGTTLAEASVEFRFPIALLPGLSGAAFVDGAIVGTRRFSDALGATAAITPGVGIRFATPAGPVRLDLGFRPRVVEALPVITQVTDSDGNFQLVTLKTSRRYDPAKATGGFLGLLSSRLTLHLAIGPAF